MLYMKDKLQYTAHIKPQTKMDPERSQKWHRMDVLVLSVISKRLSGHCFDSRLYLPLHQRFLPIILPPNTHTTATQSQIHAVKTGDFKCCQVLSLCTFKEIVISSCGLCVFLAGAAEYK